MTGLSMGGFGTWSLAAYQPKRFAALVPICGGGEPALSCATNIRAQNRSTTEKTMKQYLDLIAPPFIARNRGRSWNRGP